MRWLVLAAMLASVPAAADDGDLVPTSVKAKLRGTTIELTARVPIKITDFGSETQPLEIPDGAIVTGATVEHGGK